MKNIWSNGLWVLGGLASVTLVMGSPISIQAQSTTQVTGSNIINQGLRTQLTELPLVRPHMVVVEQDDSDTYKTLKADYDARSSSKGGRERVKQVLNAYNDKTLSKWERSNKASYVANPYQPIEIDVLDGVPAPLGVGFEELTLKGVLSKREVYGPPTSPGKSVTRSEQVFWYWEVPLSLRNDLAWMTVNGGDDKMREVMAVWFCPKKWSLQSRANPTLCYFAEKGLVWRKQIPLKETLATLPESEAFDYRVQSVRETVLVSNSGKYVWVIATTTGYDESTKRKTGNTFIFIYNDRGELTKTLQIPDYLRRDTGDVAVMDGEAFALTFVKSSRGKAEYQNVIMRADGTPVCRLVNQNGEGVLFLNISQDGQRALSHQTDEKDQKNYACFYNLDKLKNPIAK